MYNSNSPQLLWEQRDHISKIKRIPGYWVSQGLEHSEAYLAVKISKKGSTKSVCNTWTPYHFHFRQVFSRILSGTNAGGDTAASLPSNYCGRHQSCSLQPRDKLLPRSRRPSVSANYVWMNCALEHGCVGAEPDRSNTTRSWRKVWNK